jgi:outer membrane immunogenic protein
MKKILTAAIGLFALGMAPASAADMAARPYTKAPAPMVAAMYDWSGFYIGMNGGGGWSRKCWEIGPRVNPNIIVAVVNLPATDEGCHDATGGVIGGQVGYRWQRAAWVFGLEAQGNWANLSGSNLSNPLALGAVATNRTKIDSIGLFTGQVGYAANNILFYMKGGAMVVNDKYEGFTTATGVVFDRASETRWGGAIGAGIDFGITPNIVLGVDYMHGFMGCQTVTMTSVATGLLSRTDRICQDVDMVTARLSYKFGGGAVVAKY